MTATCFRIRSFYGSGSNVASLVPLVCSNLIIPYIGQTSRAKLDCGPTPCLFCFNELDSFFKSKLFCLSQNMFSYFLVSDPSHQGVEDHPVRIGHLLGTSRCCIL